MLVYNFSLPLILQNLHKNFTNIEQKQDKTCNIVNIRDEFHFSDIHRSMNLMGVSHINFIRDPLCSYQNFSVCQKNEIYFLSVLFIYTTHHMKEPFNFITLSARLQKLLKYCVYFGVQIQSYMKIGNFCEI